MWFPAAFCLYFMQACMDWVLIILGLLVIKKKPAGSYDYAVIEKRKEKKADV